jgi:uncharacterized protein YbcI
MPGHEMARSFAARLKSLTGTGPERCRVFINDDVVTLVCDRTMTPAEKTLAGAEPTVVGEMRDKLQEQVRDQFIPEVERITNRKVIAAMSAHSLDPDSSSYVFVLEGAAANGAGPILGEV